MASRSDQQYESRQIEQALNDWFLAEKKDYSVCSNKYPMNGELKEQEEELDKMRAWCDEAGITFPPFM